MLYLVIFASLLSVGLSASFPPGFPICQQIYKLEDQKTLEKCFIDASEKARSFMIQGLTEIGFPSFKDLVIPLIKVEQKTRVAAFVATLTNITAEGLEGYKVVAAKVDPTINWDLRLDITLPKVHLNGTFDVKGRFLDQALERTGQFEAFLEDIFVKVHVIIIPYNRKGVEYAKIHKFDVDPDIKKAVGKFGNIFGDNVVLNKALNQFLEDSTTYLIEAVKPDIQALVDTLIKTVGKAIVSRIPWEGVFYRYKK